MVVLSQELSLKQAIHIMVVQHNVEYAVVWDNVVKKFYDLVFTSRSVLGIITHVAECLGEIFQSEEVKGKSGDLNEK